MQCGRIPHCTDATTDYQDPPCCCKACGDSKGYVPQCLASFGELDPNCNEASPPTCGCTCPSPRGMASSQARAEVHQGIKVPSHNLRLPLQRNATKGLFPRSAAPWARSAMMLMAPAPVSKRAARLEVSGQLLPWWATHCGLLHNFLDTVGAQATISTFLLCRRLSDSGNHRR